MPSTTYAADTFWSTSTHGESMSDQPELMPTGISKKQFAALVEYASQAEKMDVVELRRRVNRHLEETRTAHSRNRIVNLHLAIAIADVAEKLLAEWDSLMDGHRNWIG